MSMCFGGRATVVQKAGTWTTVARCTPAKAHRYMLPFHPAGHWVGYDADSTYTHRIYWQDRSHVSVERNVRFTSNTVTIRVPFHSTSSTQSHRRSHSRRLHRLQQFQARQ